MLRALPALAATALTLVGLYLVLANWLGSTSILKALGEFTVNVFKTLQGR